MRRQRELRKCVRKILGPHAISLIYRGKWVANVTRWNMAYVNYSAKLKWIPKDAKRKLHFVTLRNCCFSQKHLRYNYDTEEQMVINSIVIAGPIMTDLNYFHSSPSATRERRHSFLPGHNAVIFQGNQLAGKPCRSRLQHQHCVGRPRRKWHLWHHMVPGTSRPAENKKYDRLHTFTYNSAVNAAYKRQSRRDTRKWARQSPTTYHG